MPDTKFCRLFWHSINLLIKFGCFLAFISVASYEIRKYQKNEDTTIYSVKPFQGMGWNNFPAISICFSSRNRNRKSYDISEALFNSTSIRSELNVSVKEYGKILLGLKDHDEMKKIIDYDFEMNIMNLKN